MADIARWTIYVNADGGLVSLGDDMPCEGDRYVRVVSEDDYEALAQQLAGAVHLNETLERALADALSEDPMRVMRAGRVLQMFEEQNPPAGGQ